MVAVNYEKQEDKWDLVWYFPLGNNTLVIIGRLKILSKVNGNRD